MYHNLTLIIFLPLLIPFCAAADQEIRIGKLVAGKPGPTSVAELFKSSENLQTVRSPEKLVACVLRYIEPPEGHTPRLDHYEEIQPVNVTEDVLIKLRSALLSDSTYTWNTSKLCAPRYNARLRFHRGESVVAVDFCFSCRILSITKNGHVISSGDFGDQIFLEVMRKLFPNDSTLKNAR